MGKLFSKSRIITVGLVLGVVAVLIYAGYIGRGPKFPAAKTA